MLEWPVRLLQTDPFFDVTITRITEEATEIAGDLIMVLGDRKEIMGACLHAHLARIPIAHICGGDVTEGSYDDAMRDCISRMASIHFVTSTSAMARLTHMGYRNIHLVGSTAIDFIRHGAWKRERRYKRPYVVVSYQAETIDGTNEIEGVIASLPDVFKVFIMPNPDAGSDAIRSSIARYVQNHAADSLYHEMLPHAEFLNLIYHCTEFIGNSSSMLYEAPELMVKTRMIGKRQRGRVIPWGDGFASERIVKILKYTTL